MGRSVLLALGFAESDAHYLLANIPEQAEGQVGYLQLVDWLWRPSSIALSPSGKRPSLIVMTLNLQYYASYPKDEERAPSRLSEVTGGISPPDIICVQEGLANRDVLGPVGFELCVCAGKDGMAQSVHDMVYGDAATLKGCDEAIHAQLLCNQIYVRKGTSW